MVKTPCNDPAPAGDTGGVEADEELETGYGPSAPAGDNLCNDYAQGMAEAFSSLAEARGDRVLRDDGLDLTMSDGGSPAFFGNVAVAGRPLGDADWREAAARLHDFYGGRPGGAFLVFSAWPTPDLVPLDFERIGHPPMMLRLPGRLTVGQIDGFEIRPVVDAATAEDWERAFVDGFPEPALHPVRPGCLLPEHALGVERWRHWVGYLDARPVATASAWLADHHVHVEFIATAEAARGRGIGRAMTATATLARPDLPAILIASDLGRPVYQRLGYLSVLRFTLWSGHREPSPSPSR